MPSSLAAALGTLNSNRVSSQQDAQPVQHSLFASRDTDIADATVGNSIKEPVVYASARQASVPHASAAQDQDGSDDVSWQKSKRRLQLGPNESPSKSHADMGSGSQHTADIRWGRKQKRRHRSPAESDLMGLHGDTDDKAAYAGVAGGSMLYDKQQDKQRQVLASLPSNQVLNAEMPGELLLFAT